MMEMWWFIGGGSLVVVAHSLRCGAWFIAAVRGSVIGDVVVAHCYAVYADVVAYFGDVVSH